MTGSSFKAGNHAVRNQLSIGVEYSLGIAREHDGPVHFGQLIKGAWMHLCVYVKAAVNQLQNFWSIPDNNQAACLCLQNALQPLIELSAWCYHLQVFINHIVLTHELTFSPLFSMPLG